MSTTPPVIVDDNHITFNGSKYKRLKGRKAPVRDVKDNAKRAAYMRQYRSRLKERLLQLSDASSLTES
jgi:hypothetical protein